MGIISKQQTASIHILPSKDFGELLNIGSYTDLTKELRNKNDLLFQIEEKIMGLDMEGLSVNELKAIESEICKQAIQSLVLCKALNQNVWINKGVSETQHEEAGKKARELMKEYKSLRNEVSMERRQKQTSQKLNLTEVNAAMAIAPFATYGFLNLFFPKMPAFSKGASIAVFASEIAYVIYKRNPDQWKAASKEVTIKGLEFFSGRVFQNTKRFFSSVVGVMKRCGENLFVKSLKRGKKLINKCNNDSAPS